MRSFTDTLIALQFRTVMSAITVLLRAQLPAGSRSATVALEPLVQAEVNSRGQ
jgi:hypothetical protein